LERIDLLKKLTTTPGISGHESLVRQIMVEKLGTSASFYSDNLGSVFFRFEGVEKPRIMFIAHMDEVGFIVADILDSGFIKMQPIGGWNPNTLLSSPVEIVTSNGSRHAGIIGSIPVHFKKGSDSNLDITERFQKKMRKKIMA